jgi:hypothetical protein
VLGYVDDAAAVEQVLQSNLDDVARDLRDGADCRHRVLTRQIEDAGAVEFQQQLAPNGSAFPADHLDRRRLAIVDAGVPLVLKSHRAASCRSSRPVRNRDKNTPPTRPNR